MRIHILYGFDSYSSNDSTATRRHKHDVASCMDYIHMKQKIALSVLDIDVPVMHKPQLRFMPCKIKAVSIADTLLLCI